MMCKISVVTPSFNQAQYLRRTIESVLNQGEGVDLEYIIMDGCSTDGSVDILNEYRTKAHIVIEKDAGQADALAKGFAMATGDILAWLNSDDMYLPGALAKVVDAFRDGTEFLYSHVRIVDAQDRDLRHRVALPVGFEDLYFGGYTIPQETTFFSKRLYLECGGVNPSYTYAMDYDLWLRMSRLRQPRLLDDYLACFRFHEGQKSRHTDLYGGEAEAARRNLADAPAVTFSKVLERKTLLKVRKLVANLAASGVRKTIADVIDKKMGRLPK
jgi:glycosyltransferase involved in cell wall biosynthesis